MADEINGIVPCGGLKDGQFEVVIYTYLPKPTKLTYLPDLCFFFPDFYFKNTLATITKGVFHLKSPKTDNNWVSSHLSILATVLIVL